MDVHQHLPRATEGDELTESSGKERRIFRKSFRVVIRLCPQEQRDLRAGETRSSIKVEQPNRIIVDTRRGHQVQCLEFDSVWGEGASQKDVYESTAKPLVEALLQGYNGCVITYGSPGSGKSFTLLGSSLTGKQRGIISRAAEDIFNTSSLKHKIRVTFIHVASEKIFDLLESPAAEVGRIHEGEEVVFVEGLREVEVGSSQELLQVYKYGSANRLTGVSKGEFASKSHTIFSIIAISASHGESSGGRVAVSKLTLVDLASSGKAALHGLAHTDAKKSFHTSQENPQEAKILKRSLTIFGNVIFALSSSACQHVPYRESKLTRILRDCLGGNCQTCLIVTVSSNLASTTETLSSLQFACRAMAIPGRTVCTSLLPCSRVQMQVKAVEKAKASPRRVPMQQLCTPDTKGLLSQTSLPLILPGLTPPSLRQQEEAGQRAFLPHLEKAGLADGGARFVRPARGARPVEERGGVWSRSGSIAGPPDLEARGRDRPSSRHPEAVPSPRVSVDRLVPSLTPTMPPLAPGPVQCPNCKRERKIREEYDKFIIQAGRERDGLSQRVAQLEAALQQRGSGGQDPSVQSTTGGSAAEGTALGANGEGADGVVCGRMTAQRKRKMTKNTFSQTERPPSDEESDHMKLQIESLQRELGDLREQLEECRGRDRALTASMQSERSRAAQEVEELRVRLERGRESDTQQLCQLLKQKSNENQETLVLELQDCREAHSRFKEDVALTVSGLQKEKKELLSQVKETKVFYEKVRVENAALTEMVEALKAELRSRPRPDAHTHATSPHVHTITTNTEMLVLSHHVSQQCAMGPSPAGGCLFCGCSGTPSSASPGKQPEYSTMKDDDNSLTEMKNIFKQLRREHGLLLDVMLVLYKRGWFAQDAIPYVRRTLRKCGLRLKDMDF